MVLMIFVVEQLIQSQSLQPTFLTVESVLTRLNVPSDKRRRTKRHHAVVDGVKELFMKKALSELVGFDWETFAVQRTIDIPESKKRSRPAHLGHLPPAMREPSFPESVTEVANAPPTSDEIQLDIQGRMAYEAAKLQAANSRTTRPMPPQQPLQAQLVSNSSSSAIQRRRANGQAANPNFDMNTAAS